MPEELTDSQGRIIWHGDYSLWGKLKREQHPVAGFRGQQNLRFQGQYFDRETGLHYNTFRYYAPDTGRFTQQDPIGLMGGLNLYQYAPNPVGWVDPWGLACKPVKFKRWKRGDAIDKPLPNGSAPDWDVVRSRYWKNRHDATKGTNEFSPQNMERMS